MARLARLSIGGFPHLVLQRSGPRPLVVDDVDAGRLLAAMRESMSGGHVALHGYALLPHALWLLVTPADARALGLALQAVGRRYVRAYNDRHAGRGALFDGRYRAAILEPESAFLGALQFVETQPVRAGLVAAAEEYRWSSFRHHAGFASDPMLQDHSLYWALGNTPFERQVAYRAAVHAGLAQGDVARFDRALAGGWVVGSDAFVRSIAPQCARRPAPGRAGRPRRPAASTPSG
ncbi:MAG TPA: transposase [Burkholderiaceae bacterium]|nr:transposase [Burkholderiaceae bacterium]HQR78451.1 transposase [Burkholderiaceae bacterium]